jgi:hypothetical protein
MTLLTPDHEKGPKFGEQPAYFDPMPDPGYKLLSLQLRYSQRYWPPESSANGVVARGSRNPFSMSVMFPAPEQGRGNVAMGENGFLDPLATTPFADDQHQ